MPDQVGHPPERALAAFSIPAIPISGTVMAFDFGTQRIGIAVGEIASGIAHPLTTIASTGAARRFAEIGAVLAEWHPDRLLVGVPVHMDGTEHAMTGRARRFAHQLEGRFRLPVDRVDERLSTFEATAQLHAAGVGARRQKPVRDQVAAQAMLQTWLDGNGRAVVEQRRRADETWTAGDVNQGNDGNR